MTERQWLSSRNPLQLLDHVGATIDARETFLLSAACFRRHWDRLPNAGRDWTLLADSAAEGGATRQDLDDAFDSLEEALNEFGPPGEFVALLDIAYGMWESNYLGLKGGTAWRAERAAQAALVREVFGNPFRPVVCQPRWRTETVLALARAADAGVFEAMPVLADALEEAGCNDSELLNHCRGMVSHVRGCWAVELLLGES
jgi:hypothetical protein